ncbi:hypothetical protein RDI58_019669 [Solanum bulbocastanum]|uniref:Uncharacterized protein n=1 Tax=Solanum bulbocastanum TaxID=147425 RepID=A0AAN8Y9W4_SOLBU
MGMMKRAGQKGTEIQQPAKGQLVDKEATSTRGEWQTPAKVGKSTPNTPPGQSSRIESTNSFQILQKKNKMQVSARIVGGQTIFKSGNGGPLTWQNYSFSKVSKATWIRLGYDNTRYFYSVITYRKLKHTTTQLRDTAGEWQNDPAIIAALFVEYYKGILGSTTVHRRPAIGDLIKKWEGAY